MPVRRRKRGTGTSPDSGSGSDAHSKQNRTSLFSAATRTTRTFILVCLVAGILLYTVQYIPLDLSWFATNQEHQSVDVPVAAPNVPDTTAPDLSSAARILNEARVQLAVAGRKDFKALKRASGLFEKAALHPDASNAIAREAWVQHASLLKQLGDVVTSAKASGVFGYFAVQSEPKATN